jgi:phosphotriesterase-related protein
MNRRQFLCGRAALQSGQPRVPSSVLVHEHVLVDFIGADKIAAGRYDPEEAYRAALPKLNELKEFGCVRLQECTPNFLGRDARLCRRLSEATGIDIWINTGIYGAAEHKFVPTFVRDTPARELARRWIDEVRTGVDGVKPRFLKTGVNAAPLNEIDRKLVEAAGITSLETGVTIASHTGGRGAAALEQLEILGKLRVPAAKFVWVHAQNEKDHAFHEQVARAGAWVEFDGINEKSAAWHRTCVLEMQRRGQLSRVLISQDSGWYRVGEPGGGNYRGYTYLYTGFLPQVPAELWKPLLVDNTRTAFGG